MSKILSKLLGSQGLRSAALMSAGNVTATVISAVAMIIISRLLGPERFGVFSVIFSLLIILSKVGDFGINTAVQRELARHKGEEAFIKKIAQSGAYLKVIIIIVLAAVGLIFSKYLGAVLHIGGDSYLITWTFLFVGGVIIYDYLNTLLQGKEYFTLSVGTNFVQSFGKLICAALFLFFGISLPAVTLLYLFMPLAGSLLGLLKVPFHYLLPRVDKKSLSVVLSVTKWTSIAIVAAALADNLDVLIVQNFLNSFDTGVWSAAVRIATVASLVGWSLGIVLNVRIATYHDQTHLHAYLRKAFLVSLAALIGISLTGLFSSPMLYFTVGPEFLSGTSALKLLLVSTALLTATSPFVALFYLFDKPAYFAWSGILSTVALLLSDVVLIPSYGLLGAGYARIITRIVVLAFTLYYARRAYQEKYA